MEHIGDCITVAVNSKLPASRHPLSIRPSRYVPDETLVDGGSAKHEDIEKASSPDVGTVVHAPVQKPKKGDRDPHVPRPGDSEVIAAWRERMGTAAAEEIY